jgi:hypothetical protein
MNKDRHAKNRLPKNASLEQRVGWHEEHAADCACRPVPARVRAAIGKKDFRR